MFVYSSLSLNLTEFTKFSLQTIKGEPPKIKNFYDQGLSFVKKLFKYKLFRFV